MKNRLIWLMVLFLTLFSGCGERKAENRLRIPPHTELTVYEKSPVKSAPLGYFKVTTAAEHESDLYIGTDAKVIPAGTFLYLNNIGFRVATADTKVQGKAIIVYENTDTEEVFIWVLIKAKLSDSELPFIQEL